MESDGRTASTGSAAMASAATPGQPDLPALRVEPAVRGIQEGQHLRSRVPVRSPHDPLGLDRTGAGRQGPVGQGRAHVRLAVDPVTRTRARRRRQHAVALEVAHLLDGVPSPPGHIDRAQAG